MKGLEDVISEWGISPRSIENGDSVQGSPRRVVDRYVIVADERYVLERISWAKRERREEQASILESMAEKRLPVERYLRTEKGTFLVEKDGLWMLKRFIPGTPLPRPGFLQDAWRGKASAEFVLSMSRASEGKWLEVSAAHLPSFIDGLMRRMRRKMPDTMESLKRAYESISELLDLWDSLPSSFSHGDYHPMNIIWGEKKINAVIDWEFMGTRPELYDAASMLGCIGIEDSDGLFSPFAEEFLISLKKGDFRERSWELLPELIIATRFAWLDEWIRNRDEEMIDAEIFYMQVLSENIPSLRDFFSNWV